MILEMVLLVFDRPTLHLLNSRDLFKDHMEQGPK